MGENGIGGVGRTRPDGHDGATPFYARLVRPSKSGSVPPPAPRLRDRVELTPPAVAALELLRQRVHQASWQKLELPLRRDEHRFHAAATSDAVAVLGRILGDQGQLAAQREALGGWTWPRIEQALHDGVQLGAEETLAILDELGQLDDHAWGAVCSVLDLWGERLKRAASER